MVLANNRVFDALHRKHQHTMEQFEARISDLQAASEVSAALMNQLDARDRIIEEQTQKMDELIKIVDDNGINIVGELTP